MQEDRYKSDDDRIPEKRRVHVRFVSGNHSDPSHKNSSDEESGDEDENKNKRVQKDRNENHSSQDMKERFKNLDPSQIDRGMGGRKRDLMSKRFLKLSMSDAEKDKSDSETKKRSMSNRKLPPIPGKSSNSFFEEPKCSVCGNSFIEPVKLDCNHSICKQCLILKLNENRYDSNFSTKLLKNCKLFTLWIANYLSRSNKY